MKKFFVVFLLMLAGTAVPAQNLSDTLNGETNGKPTIKIKVNKVYDENGNIIGYDSTYVWSWSGRGADTAVTINPDSLFSRFRPYFDEHFMHFPADPFTGRFFSDSTMYFDFFNNDHFFDRWQDELFDFQREIRKMDSLKRLFFKKYIEEQKEKNPYGKGKIY